jgi:hypothetical protein
LITRGNDRIAIAAFLAEQFRRPIEEHLDDALMRALRTPDVQFRREFADRDGGGLILRTTGARFIESHGGFPWLLGGIRVCPGRHVSARRSAKGDAPPYSPSNPKSK